MSAPHAAPTASALTTAAVPVDARALAARLAALFETDQKIVARLNGAHHLLAGANDRLWADPAADPLQVHQQIHRAFCAYQQASESSVSDLPRWRARSCCAVRFGHTSRTS
jgi:hypothetical protein